MLPRYQARVFAVLAIALLSGSLAACSERPSQPLPLPQPSETTTPTDPQNRSIDWNDILSTPSVPTGWAVSPCENPMMLCVKRNGESVGRVELFATPVAGSEFETMLRNAGAPAGAVDPQSAQMQNALKAWVENFYASIERDRATGASDVTFSSQPSEAVPVGQLQGLRYEFASTRDGTLLERTTGYVASDGTTLYVITAGVMNGDAIHMFSEDATLQEFEPHLEQIVAGLNLPVTN